MTGAQSVSEMTGPGGIKFDAQDIVDLATIGACEIAEGCTRAEWNATMSMRLGAWVEPYLDELWDLSEKHLDAKIAEAEKRIGKPTAEKVKGEAAPETEGLGVATAGEVGGGGEVRPMPKEVLDAAAIRYGQKLMEGASTRAAFDAAVRADYGKKADPYLNQIWEAANKHVEEYLSGLEKRLGEPTAEKVKRSDERAELSATGGAVRSEVECGGSQRLPKEVFNACVSYGASQVARGMIDRAHWDAHMTAVMGDGIKPQLDEIWNGSLASWRLG